MRPIDDPGPRSSNARLTELATIFASAILRLRDRAAIVAEPDPETAATCLEVSPETVLLDHHG